MDPEQAKKVAVLKKETTENLISVFVGTIRSLIMRKRLSEAAKSAERLKELVPKCSIAYDYLGYIAYISGKEKDAKKYFKEGKDLGSAYSRGRYSELLLAQNQSEFLEDFNREDSKDLRNNWVEKEVGGIEINITDNKALFKGTVTEPWSISRFAKSYPASPFVNMSVNVKVEKEHKDVFAGIFVIGQKSEQGIFLVRSDKGKICFSSSDLQTEEEGWRWYPVGNWPLTEVTNICLKQIDKGSRKFELRVNDKKVKVLLSGSLIKEEYFKVGCFIQADKGKVVKVWFDDLRVITEKN
jgi:hypothetical protein